ncbi:zonadhesin-like [Oppia nitens]|uniref:zonadhesin-like n=1 Tax=Oppia nitens TaxID=1686743 RepID=UPI0023DA386D|nr:zonadhesin-like [Oppia nitens]
MNFLYSFILTSILEITGIYSQCTVFRNTEFQVMGQDCKCSDYKKHGVGWRCPIGTTTGCFCKSGYFRSWSWDCIRGSQCFGGETDDQEKPKKRKGGKSSKRKCQKNEVWADCGNRCTELCRNAGKNNCPQNKCEQTCVCKDSYFRDEEGDCVPFSKCGVKFPATTPSTIKDCPVGEKYRKCDRRCAENCHKSESSTSKCEKEKCVSGCFCKNGYKRNSKGTCVPSKECRTVGGTCTKHESFQICGNPCVDLCIPPRECPVVCKPGCYCKSGYFRNTENKKCVVDNKENWSKIGKLITKKLGRQCPEIPKSATPKPRTKDQCSKNEYYKQCGTKCGESCAAQKMEGGYVCPRRKICVRGCFCNPGYYRNTKGKCVPEAECDEKKPKKSPKKCKKTEEYKECGNPCVELCNPPTICPYECESGCYCKKEYYRNKKGKCVPLNKCPELDEPESDGPKTCPAKQKYSECRKNCIQHCYELTEKMVCPRRKVCLNGCFCEDGELKSSTGLCLPANKCPKPTDPVKPNSKKPNDGDDPIKSCSKNEEYFACGDYCIELCDPPAKCPRKCKKGCFCSRGFLRNKKGKCIPENKCPNKLSEPKNKEPKECKKENEVFMKCGSSCGEKCSDQAEHVMCPMREKCEVGCFCRGGFFRNDKNKCVPIGKCTPKVPKWSPKSTTPKNDDDDDKCPANEHFNDCGDHCIELCQPPDSCENQCEKGCFCDTGFYRAKAKGPCIPEKKCPNSDEPPEDDGPVIKFKIKFKCEDGEIYKECGTRCGEPCNNLFKSVTCPKKGLCVTGCYCKIGMHRNNKGKCVLPSQCPDDRPPPSVEPKCSDNEVFNKCGDRCKQSCDHQTLKTTCPPNKCSAGCFCVDGYFKDSFGNCVKLEDCPKPFDFGKPFKITCDNNEIFTDCGKRCGQTCRELNEKVECNKIRSCVAGCFCKKGLIRNNDGKCIQPTDCPKPKTNSKMTPKCEDNEEYSKCNTRCAQGCDDIGRKVDCPKDSHCVSGCFCKEGYFRNEQGDCVPESDCPVVGPPEGLPRKIDCGSNEQYNECGTRCGQGCEDLGRGVTCPQRRICISGCFCTNGFFRDDEGNCVPMLDCPNISPVKRPPPTCDANEQYRECGQRCGQSCDDNLDKCPKKQACVSGCFCTGNYRRDQNGVCVKECPKRPSTELDPASVKCGKNEHYSECGTRCGQGCEDLSHAIECPKNRMCASGCFCDHGYYRNELGDCVPESKCPSVPVNQKPQSCGENEVFTDCGTHCGETCDEIGTWVKCPRKRMCIAGCFCRTGFFRDVNDDCVPQRQCSEKKDKKKMKEKTTRKPEKDDEDYKVDDNDGQQTPSDDISEEPETEENTTEGPENTTEAPEENDDSSDNIKKGESTTKAAGDSTNSDDTPTDNKSGKSTPKTTDANDSGDDAADSTTTEGNDSTDANDTKKPGKSKQDIVEGDIESEE